MITNYFFSLNKSMSPQLTNLTRHMSIDLVKRDNTINVSVIIMAGTKTVSICNICAKWNSALPERIAFWTLFIIPITTTKEKIGYQDSIYLIPCKCLISRHCTISTSHLDVLYPLTNWMPQVVFHFHSCRHTRCTMRLTHIIWVSISQSSFLSWASKIESHVWWV